METEYSRPKFLASYFEAMSERITEKGWWVIVPCWLAAGMAGGAIAAYLIPDSLWIEQNWEPAVALYAALLTINGLMLAVSWSAFSRIHESILSSPGFCLFLRQAKLLSTYLFYIDYVQVTQLIAVITSGAALFSLFAQFPSPLWHRVILAVSVGLSLYALKYAANAVILMHDLVWHRAVFEEQEMQAPKKVVPIGGVGRGNG